MHHSETIGAFDGRLLGKCKVCGNYVPVAGARIVAHVHPGYALRLPCLGGNLHPVAGCVRSPWQLEAEKYPEGTRVSVAWGSQKPYLAVVVHVHEDGTLKVHDLDTLAYHEISPFAARAAGEAR